MFYKLTRSILGLLMVGMLFACENSIKTIQEITMEDTLPDLTAYNIVYERMASQYKKVLLKSPYIIRHEGEEPSTTFPEGFEVTFYDTTGKAISFISANYGINLIKKNIMQARNNVVVINYETQEQLDTENLVWDQNKHEIYSNTFVKLTSPDRVVFGDSMRAEESFASREIFNISAELQIADSLEY